MTKRISFVLYIICYNLKKIKKKVFERLLLFVNYMILFFSNQWGSTKNLNNKLYSTRGTILILEYSYSL